MLTTASKLIARASQTSAPRAAWSSPLLSSSSSSSSSSTFSSTDPAPAVGSEEEAQLKANVHHSDNALQSAAVSMESDGVEKTTAVADAAVLVVEEAHARYVAAGLPRPDWLKASRVIANAAAVWSRAGDNDKSWTLVNRALEVLVDDAAAAGTDPPPDQYVAILCNVGAAHARRGEMGEASSKFQEAESVAAKEYGTSHPAWATVMVRVAAFHRDVGQMNSSRQRLLAAAKVWEACGAVPEGTEPIGDVITQALADVSDEERNSMDSTSEGVFDPSEFGDIVSADAPAPDAQALAVTAAVAKKAPGGFHPTYVLTLDELGFTLFRSGAWAAAAAVLLKTVHVRAAVQGGEAALALAEELGHAFSAHEQHHAAAEFLEIVVASEAALMEEDGGVPVGYPEHLANLGATYLNAGELDKAESTFEAGIELAREMASSHAETDGTLVAGSRQEAIAVALHNAAGVALRKKDGVKAVAMYEEVLSLREAINGKNSMEYASALTNSAAIAVELEQGQEAMDKLEEAVAIRETLGGEALTDRAHGTTLHSLGAVYARGELWDDAIRVVEAAKEVHKAHGGVDDEDYRTSRDFLAALYQAAGRPEEATNLLKSK